MSYHRVWLQGKRSTVAEGDAFEFDGTSGDVFEPWDVIIRKGGRVVARFARKAVGGYDKRKTAYAAPPRLPAGV